MTHAYAKIWPWLFAFCTLAPERPVHAQVVTATDAVGRSLPDNQVAGDPRTDRHVALFYFLWQDKVSTRHWDLTKIVSRHPEVLHDFHSPYWGGGGMYYWGEPLYGYYRADDYWVQLRNMQLLTDAGVDMVVIDATNGLVYPRAAEALMSAMDAIRKQGYEPPRIVFYTNSASGKTMEKAYRAFYAPGAPYRHPDCWYRIDGKPLIIGDEGQVKDTALTGFFTFRKPQWPNEPAKVNGWPWIDFVRPQRVYVDPHGQREIVSVSVAQHPNWKEAGMGGAAFYGNRDNWGRSYHQGVPGDPAKDLLYGYNFQEQWDYALSQQTPYVFVTGWNEWIAGRFPSNDGHPEHSWFCDEASAEYSRDLEPTRTAGLGDTYYLQLVACIRRYKGIAGNPTVSGPQSIRNLSDWSAVAPVYRDYTGDVAPRDHPAAVTDPPIRYRNHTGRNDFHKLKVARDRRNVYFYAETTRPITPDTARNWMRLYLDVDRDAKTGWLGYDYRVSEGRSLERYVGGKWGKVHALRCIVHENQLMITVPRHYLGLKGALNIAFKWSDNMQDEGDPLDWYLNGDAAPGGRFSFVYKTGT